MKDILWIVAAFFLRVTQAFQPVLCWPETHRLESLCYYIERKQGFHTPYWLEASREDKLAALRKKVEQQNGYLHEHPRARVDGALKRLQEYAAKLRITAWAILSSDGESRRITLGVDEEALAEVSKFDGCYVLKTDLRPEVASKETVQDRYKDLALVEQAFRTSKTVELELRPIHVRLAS